MLPRFQSSSQTRRDFLRRSSQAAFSAGILSQFGLIQSALADTTANDYKALVCVFLSGGNDGNNWIVPTDTATYADYSAARTSSLALIRSELQANNLQTQSGNDFTDPAGHTYGMHPACVGLRSLFNQGKLAGILNVGPLLAPTTRTQYLERSVELPPDLFQHEAQESLWQTCLLDPSASAGWGGRCADILSVVNAGGEIPTCVTLAGANRFAAGASTTPYAVSTAGSVSLVLPADQSGNTMTRQQAMRNLLALGKNDTNLQIRAYSEALDSAIANYGADLTNAINDSTNNTAYSYLVTNGATNFPNVTPLTGNPIASSLMAQLRMVSRLIEAGRRSAASGGLGMKRQIFFVQLNGFDTHSNQANADTKTGTHSNRLAELSQSITAFYNALIAMNATNNVTLFTASEFGRSLQSNGSGSEHGWGNHQIVVGGAVNGRNLYGQLPVLRVGGPDDVGNGRWIPTLAVEQYSAILAKWWGADHTVPASPVPLLSDNDLATIFPNLSRFGPMTAFV